jgi:hypothetical protein
VPTWKQLYAAAMIETRPIELEIVIAETERAISARLREISNDSDNFAERLELDNAATTIEILSKEMIAWQNY